VSAETPDPDTSAAEPAPAPAASPAPGVKVGPMIFVGGLRSGPDDPWAHRKGEPRPLALMWASYICVSAALTIFSVSFITIPSHDQFAYACRALFVMLAVGATVLWPMVRLSQQFPRRSMRSVLIDTLVILIPVQAVLWPMPMLTKWSYEINGALAANFGAWTVLAGAILLIGFTSAGHAARTLWTLLCVLTIVAAPLAYVLTSAPHIVLWLSPITSVFQITAAPPALAPAMTRTEWLLSLSPAAPGLLLYVLGAVLHSAPPEQR